MRDLGVLSAWPLSGLEDGISRLGAITVDMIRIGFHLKASKRSGQARPRRCAFLDPLATMVTHIRQTS